VRARTGRNCIHWYSSWLPEGNCSLPGKSRCRMPCEDFLSRSAVKRLGGQELAEEEKKLKQSIHLLQQQLLDLTSERGRILATLTHEFAEFRDEVRDVFIWFWSREKESAEELTRRAFELRRNPKITTIPCTNGEELRLIRRVWKGEGGLYLFSDGRFFSEGSLKAKFLIPFRYYCPDSIDYVLLNEDKPFTNKFVDQLKKLAPIPARFVQSIRTSQSYCETPQELIRVDLRRAIRDALDERLKDFKTLSELENEALNITLKQLIVEYEAMKGLGADG